MRGRLVLGAVAVLLLGMALVGSGCAGGPVGAADAPATPPEPVELRVSAATSLKEVLEKTAPGFEESNDAKLIFNFGASGVLQKQIEGGAPVDVFVSASPKHVASLTAEALVNDEAASTFAGNDLVVFVPNGNPAGINGPGDLAKADRLVTGNPATAPHGAKAKEWLEGLGSWVSLQPRFVFAENSAQTLDYVARGEVDAGIGFASEAVGSEQVDVAYAVPKGEIEPIRYVAAPLVVTDHADLAAAYAAYLRTPEVQRALIDAGFLPAPTN